MVHNTSEPTVSNPREWIPPMLRKSRAISLCVTSLLFGVILEVMRILVAKDQGISTHNTSIVYIARYFPTAGTIILGFIWKALVGDVKMILPWSLMSAGWASPGDSIALNYINSLEITSVFAASKRKHWVMVLVLTVGFLTGASVAIANIVTYTEPLAVVKVETELVKTSIFSFDNAFVYPNGTITLPLGHLGTKPYAAVTAQRLSGGKFAPWTMDEHCFESFGIQSSGTPDDSIIEATVSAISVDFNCEKLRYSTDMGTGGDDHTYRANTEDLSQVGCRNPITQVKGDYGGTSSYHATAWINVTTCTADTSNDRILATISTIEGVDVDAGIVGTKTTGLICHPRYTIRNSSVRANPSSGDIASYTMLSDPVPIDIPMSTEAAWIYLNNPTDTRLQGLLDSPSLLRADMDSVIKIIDTYVKYYPADPFFDILTTGRLEEIGDSYINDTDVFKSDVESLASRILAQVVNMLGRGNESQQMPGTITTTGPRLFIQTWAIHTLQIILLIICIACILVSSLLRPSSRLRENPTPIAATAVVLAASEVDTEKFFLRHHTSSDDYMRKELSGKQCQLGYDQHLGIEMENLSVSRNTVTPADRVAIPHETGTSVGWRPLSLSVWAKWGTILALCAAITTLAVLQSFSIRQSGLGKSSSTAQAVFNYVTTAILLILSYICSGIDSSIRSLNSYDILRQSSRKRPLLLRSKEWPTFWVAFGATGIRSGLAVIASSMTLLLFPVIKIVAAGLFANIQMVVSTMDVDVVVDTSLVDNLASLDYYNDSRPQTQRAAQFTEWTVTPSLDIPQRSGIIDNIVISNFTGFSNHTGNGNFSGFELQARVPAIAIDVRCSSTAEDDFEVATEPDSNCGAPMFSFKCATNHCRDIVNLTDANLTDTIHLLELWSDPVCPPLPFTGVCFSTDAATWRVALADFSASSPSLRAVSCERNMSVVDIDVSFTQSGTATTGLTWNPSRVDHHSISYISQYPESVTDGWYKPWGSSSTMSHSFNLSDTSIGGVLNDTTLWPSSGGSSNPFQLLAAFAEYKHHNLTSLLDPVQLGQISEDMYTAFVAQMLTEMRPYTSDLVNSTSPSRKMIHGTLLDNNPRITQDLRTTIILESLLVLVFVCVLWIFFSFTGTPILPKEPDSIASRLSLLAGSNIVQHLRNEGVGSVRDTDIWTEQSSLGWWKVSGSSGAADSSRRWRWGIDVGTDVHHSSWKTPPEDMSKVNGAPMATEHILGTRADNPQHVAPEREDGLTESQSLLPVQESTSRDRRFDGVQPKDDSLASRRRTW